MNLLNRLRHPFSRPSRSEDGPGHATPTRDHSRRLGIFPLEGRTATTRSDPPRQDVEVIRDFTSPAIFGGEPVRDGAEQNPVSLVGTRTYGRGTPAGTGLADWANLWGRGTAANQGTATTDPPAPAAGTDYANSKLSSRVSEGTKQYLFEGQPVFPPYPHGAAKPEKEEGEPRSELGRGKFYVVTERYNENASVYRKVPHNDYVATDIEKAIEAGRVMDEVARVLLGSDADTQRMAQHFAIELLKKVRNGQPVFLTRAVDGMTLKQYMRTMRKRRPFPIEQLNEKAEELFAALDWLRGKGYFHEDLTLENVMYDRSTGKMVLIDFDSLKRHDASTDEAYAANVQQLRDLLE